MLLLLLSITTLVQVEQASSANTVSRMKAKQAALLSLNMAMGKLQESAGLDQRVTASAEAVASVNGPKQLTGVWRSWEGRDHQSNGLPIAPDYASKLVTGDKDINVSSSGSGRFLSWLVSSAYDPANTTSYNAGAANPPSLLEVAGTVPLVGAGSVGADASNPDYAEENEVHLAPTEINDGDGAIAWWISGENTKALLRETDAIASSGSDGVAEWSERLSSSASPDASEFKITDVSNLDRVVNRESLNLLDNTVSSTSTLSKTYFHDLTGYARGLLTNTANGGWRRDLSLMSEQWDTLKSPSGSASEFPFFTRSPGAETAALKSSGTLGGLIYPWAAEQEFEVIGAVVNNNQTKTGGASVGWNALVDYSLKYRAPRSAGSGPVTFPMTEGGRDEVPHRPVITRFHWVFSFGSEDLGTDPATHQAYLIANPVFTLWNPYNVAIEDHSGRFDIRINEPLPYGFKFKVGAGGSATEQDEFYTADTMAKDGEFTIWVQPLGDTWKPGEARVYSGKNVVGGKTISLDPGYRTDTGFKWKLFKTYTAASRGKFTGSTELVGSAGDLFTVELEKQAISQFTVEAYRTGGTPMAMEMLYKLPDYLTSEYWPDLTVKQTTLTLGDVNIPAGDQAPFLVAVMQHRGVMAEWGTEESTTTRGYSDNKPALFFTSPNIYPLTSYAPEPYPDGFPYDWLFFTPNDIIDTEGMPQAGGASEDIGYLGTSFRADTGLPNLVVSELPLRPLSSLGELQHFDVNYYNPMPPYIANPIGNSNATFAIKSDYVYIDDSTPEVERSGYDHSYVSNHLFFDDWFVSSITPEVANWPYTSTRSIDTVYREFVSGNEDLVNSAYKPVEVLSASEAATAASSLISDDTAWHDVASKLEVEGMFNINSTSVEAWSALLRHLNDGSMPHLSVQESAWDVDLETGSDHPLSRTTIAGDPNPRSADPYDFNSLGAHKRFTDEQIGALAVEIVNQIKQRGPFLSLSEFVNRQLTADSSAGSLALAGTIEAALNELYDDGAATNPYSKLISTFVDKVDETVTVTRPFDEAAKGYRAYGFPGWIRQADVLRPLAPVLSARDDTFIIRAYGESKNPISGETEAGAWCEAVVQRSADYVNSEEDNSTILPSEDTLISDANKRFGRRFTIVSFRWLSKEEI
ncbi:hypothetical protein N9P58_01360 [Puniceicoccaceae bacterium]|nr:hypothetical protein [Puniceicoccaceae bacterium]